MIKSRKTTAHLHNIKFIAQKYQTEQITGTDNLYKGKTFQKHSEV